MGDCLTTEGVSRLSFSSLSSFLDSDNTFITSTLVWIVVEQLTCPPIKNRIWPLAS